MKKLLSLVFILLFLSCGCKGGESPLSNPTSQGQNMAQDATQDALQEYEGRLKQAATAKNLSYIKIDDDITITDPAIIRRWISILQTSELKSAPYEFFRAGELGFGLTFGYSDKEVFLGVFFTDCIDINYDDPPVKCTLNFQNNAGAELRLLAKEAGFSESMYP